MAWKLAKSPCEKHHRGSCDCRMTNHYRCSSMVCKCTHEQDIQDKRACNVNKYAFEGKLSKNIPQRNGLVMKIDPVNCPSIGQFYLPIPPQDALGLYENVHLCQHYLIIYVCLCTSYLCYMYIFNYADYFLNYVLCHKRMWYMGSCRYITFKIESHKSIWYDAVSFTTGLYHILQWSTE